MSTRQNLIIVVAMLLSFLLCLLGIKFGLPKKQQTELVFSDQKELEILSPFLEARRDEIYKHYLTQGPIHILHNVIPKGNEVVLNLDGKEVTVSTKKLDALRTYLLHSQFSDEQVVLKAVSQINWRNLDFNPRFFIYGGHYLYFIGTTLKIGSMLGLNKISSDIKYYFHHPNEVAKLFIIPKACTIIFFIFSIPIFFLACKICYDDETALLGAIIYAFIPIIIVYSHFLKPHVFVLPFVVTSILFANKLLTTNEKKWYFLTGLFAGFATGGFYYAGIIILYGLTAHILKVFSYKDVHIKEKIKFCFNKNIFLFVIAILVGFFIANPYWILCPKQPILDIKFISSGLSIFSPSFHNLKVYLFDILPNGLGWPLWMFVVLGIAFAFYKRSKVDIMCLSCIIPLGFYAISANPDFWLCNLHLSTPIIPLLVLLAARLLRELFLSGRRYWLKTIPIVFVVVWTFFNSLYYSIIFIYGDNKLKAGKWINENIRPGSTIGGKNQLFSDCGGYPPFYQLRYNTVDGPPLEKMPDFYITIGQEEETTTSQFQNVFEVEKRFTRVPWFLDKVYKNYLIPFVDIDVVIYKKINVNN
ncbi:MAG: glycosyltransferase family 39 protein [Elusimicrobiota bacterium]